MDTNKIDYKDLVDFHPSGFFWSVEEGKETGSVTIAVEHGEEEHVIGGIYGTCPKVTRLVCDFDMSGEHYGSLQKWGDYDRDASRALVLTCLGWLLRMKRNLDLKPGTVFCIEPDNSGPVTATDFREVSHA
ncbi:hypothetical protein [Salinicola rhizosphaerae]|uniref:Uncharacterized protein n=1 Tax=Salinicola rhizosphaerae TaxID=1443141 RepID=A0ABQ3DU96_9GAMM|nr:hypothetical protein [Salinicola rhizosphaerae]GHB13003.1 hypothetical protein GCM10009038_08830 [Salinicola rhizosphaerae]